MQAGRGTEDEVGGAGHQAGMRWKEMREYVTEQTAERSESEEHGSPELSHPPQLSAVLMLTR